MESIEKKWRQETPSKEAQKLQKKQIMEHISGIVDRGDVAAVSDNLLEGPDSEIQPNLNRKTWNRWSTEW